MSIDFHSLLDSVKLFHIVILSTLTGYLLAGPASLRLWIATQKAPSGPDQNDEPIIWKKRMIGFGILLTILAAEYALMFHTSAQVLNGVLYALFGTLVTSGCAGLFINLTEAIKWSVHRNAQGVPVTSAVPQKGTWKRTLTLWAGLLGSICVSAAAFITNYQALVALASTALVYNMSRRTGFRSISMRWMIICLLGWIAGSMSLGAALVFFLVSKGRSGSSDSNDFVPHTETFDHEWVTWTHERAWIFPPLYAYVPGMFIALCLRFDYQRHLDSSPNSASEFVLADVPAPEPKKGKKQQLGEGILVPSRAPTAFSKVYYATALVAWGATQLGLVCIDAFTDLALESGYEFSVLVLVLELPIMCLALMSVAAVRGEWEVLWRYREVWTVKPEAKDSSSPEAEQLTQREEEGKVADVEQL